MTQIEFLYRIVVFHGAGEDFAPTVVDAIPSQIQDLELGASSLEAGCNPDGSFVSEVIVSDREIFQLQLGFERENYCLA